MQKCFHPRSLYGSWSCVHLIHFWEFLNLYQEKDIYIISNFAVNQSKW